MTSIKKHTATIVVDSTMLRCCMHSALVCMRTQPFILSCYVLIQARLSYVCDLDFAAFKFVEHQTNEDSEVRTQHSL